MAFQSVPPLVISPGTDWLGNDGNWSTFPLAIGTPPQNFSILPAIASSEIWIPGAEDCPWPSSASFNCGQSRGVGNATGGVQRTGFQTNQSSTWDQIGLYNLSGAEYLPGNANSTAAADSGVYGLDSVVLGDDTSDSLSGQTIAGIAANDFWLGTVGFGVQPAQFDDVANMIPSLLTSMRTANLTPSLSLSYTAGASYRNSAGSLIIGGYDRSRSSKEIISVSMSNDPPLIVNVRGILLQNTLTGTSATPNATEDLLVAIDSRASQLVLPHTVCDSFQKAFGLVYEPSIGRYLLNSTTHDTLLNANPSVTFTIAANTSSNSTVNIELPYAAFDLQLGMPYYNGSLRYFPIIPTSNASHYVLGRTFLQEAYIVVDWERDSFGVSQAIHDAGAPAEIMTILPRAPTNHRRKSSLSTAAIAGIAVGGAAAALVLIAIAIVVWKKRSPPPDQPIASDGEQGEQTDADGEKAAPYPEKTELSSDEAVAELPTFWSVGVEANSTPIHEMAGHDDRAQLMSKPLYELEGSPGAQALPFEESKDEAAQPRGKA